MKNDLSKYKWVFFGTPQIAVDFLSHLADKYDLHPDLIVSNPDKFFGREKELTPPPVAQYALKNKLPLLQTSAIDDITEHLSGYDFFCVFAYGSLLKKQHLELPNQGVVNIHPSLLPQYRGPSPITTAILADTKLTGVSLMQMELSMDTGPIIAQEKLRIDQWSKWNVHEQQMAELGADLFHEHMPHYLEGNISPVEQDASDASYCPKYQKENMEINLNSDPYTQYRTYCAFPKPFFISPSGLRFIVTLASYYGGRFLIQRVIPAGKKERDFRAEDLE